MEQWDRREHFEHNRRECNNSYEEIIYIICIAGGEEYK